MLFKVDDIGLTDPQTFKTISKGDTVGIFQLESRLGSEWAKKLKPETIDDIAALTTLLRPGALSSGETEKYCNRKNKKEEVVYKDPALETILKDTYGCLIYQEQIISVAQEIAGFNEVEGDTLRKSLGRKDAKLMSELKDKFIQGCKKTGRVTEQAAEELFEDIKKSQMYIFNKCISADTVVNTTSGNITAKDLYNLRKIKEKFQCYSYDFTNKKVIIANIVDVMFSGIVQTYKVFTQSNTCKVTLNHKFPTKDGRKKLSDIKVGDIIYRIDIDNKEIFEDKIIKIEQSDIQEVYDIEVDNKDHNFVINDSILTCNSHSYEYGILTYQTAYLKTHYPNQFFCSYLIHSKNKPATFLEIEGLIEDARHYNIQVLPPILKTLNKDFVIEREGEIRFGLASIKGIGESSLKTVEDKTEAGESWCKFVLYADKIGRRVWESLVKSGSLSYFELPRTRMIEELDLIFGNKDKAVDNKGYSSLTKKEIPEFMTAWSQTCDLEKSLQHVLDVKACQKTRIPVIEEKIKLARAAFKMQDTNRILAAWERHFLGKSLTTSASLDYKDSSHKKLSLIIDDPMVQKQRVCLYIDKMTIKTAKSGNSKYAVIDASDNSASQKYIKIWQRDLFKVKSNLCTGCVVEGVLEAQYYNGSRGFVLSDIQVLG